MEFFSLSINIGKKGSAQKYTRGIQWEPNSNAIKEKCYWREP